VLAGPRFHCALLAGFAVIAQLQIASHRELLSKAYQQLPLEFALD
jgi:hypothetical protein